MIRGGVDIPTAAWGEGARPGRGEEECLALNELAQGAVGDAQLARAVEAQGLAAVFEDDDRGGAEYEIRFDRQHDACLCRTKNARPETPLGSYIGNIEVVYAGEPDVREVTRNDGLIECIVKGIVNEF